MEHFLGEQGIGSHKVVFACLDRHDVAREGLDTGQGLPVDEDTYKVKYETCPAINAEKAVFEGTGFEYYLIDGEG